MLICTTVDNDIQDRWLGIISLGKSQSLRTLIFNLNRLLFPILLLVIIGCPAPPDDPLECGNNQVLIDSECQCIEGFHWNDDCTECLLDTTSHNFVWTIDTLGIKGSYLKDVWIEAEDDIWVVGNIRVDDPDSSFNGTGWKEYNAAHWDGNNWELSGFYSTTLDLYSILYFSEDNIWVTDHCSPIHWDGEEWTLYHLENMGLDACAGLDIWGTSSANMYFVGIEGSVVHYNGSDFTKLTIPNETKLVSIDGTKDGEYVFVAGYDYYVPVKTTALMIHDDVVTELYYSDNLVPSGSSDFGAVTSVSVCGDTAYFVTYQGFWKYNYLTGESVVDKPFKNYDYSSLNVQSPNDIFMIGGGFYYVHYNGASWDFNYQINEQYPLHDYGAGFVGDIAVIVGSIQGWINGIVARGLR